jgi:hypothetical protein
MMFFVFLINIFNVNGILKILQFELPKFKP